MAVWLAAVSIWMLRREGGLAVEKMVVKTGG